jgi:DNA-binding Lrp family transcriptional regulator
MDRTDILLIKMLLTDSRKPYRELAEKLDLSVNAVHKRIQLLIEAGVIKEFTTKISLPALDAIVVLIYGHSRGKMDEVSARLGQDERIYWVSQSSGGMVYVGAYLRNIGELEEVVSAVRSKGLVDAPTIGIMAAPPGSPDQELELSKMDYRIIRSLEHDSRKAVSDIAVELNTSAKTVRRRLDRLIEGHLIEFSLEWYPDAANDIISMFHIQMEPGVDRIQFAFSLLSKYALEGLFFFIFSNLPDLVMFCTWSSSMKDVNNMRRSLDTEPGVAASAPYILYSGQVYGTWREERVNEALGPKA